MRETMKQMRSGRNRIIKKKLEILKKVLKLKRRWWIILFPAGWSFWQGLSLISDLHAKFVNDKWRGDFHFLRSALKVGNSSDEAYLRTAVRFWKLFIRAKRWWRKWILLGALVLEKPEGERRIREKIPAAQGNSWWLLEARQGSPGYSPSH